MRATAIRWAAARRTVTRPCGRSYCVTRDPPRSSGDRLTTSSECRKGEGSDVELACERLVFCFECRLCRRNRFAYGGGSEGASTAPSERGYEKPAGCFQQPARSRRLS